MAKVKKVSSKRSKTVRGKAAAAKKPSAPSRGTSRVMPKKMKKTAVVLKKHKAAKPKTPPPAAAPRAAKPAKAAKAAKALPRVPLTPELRQVRVRLQAMLTERRKDIDQEVRGASERDLAHINDTSDMASDAADGDLALRIAESETVEASEIERAIEKIDTGTYGLCEVCNKPINTERLQFLPHSTLCVKCQSLAELRKRERKDELDDLASEGGEPDAENN